MSTWMMAADFGWMLLAGAILLGGGGYLLDGRLHSSLPLFTIAGILLAIVISFMSLFRRLHLAEEQERRERRRRSPGDSNRDDSRR